MGVRNLPKVFTRQRPGRESNPVSAIHKSDALPVSHRATETDRWQCLIPPPYGAITIIYGLYTKCFTVMTAVTPDLSRNKAGRKTCTRLEGDVVRESAPSRTQRTTRVAAVSAADNCRMGVWRAQCTMHNDPRPSFCSLNRGSDAGELYHE